jgi:hypothetical protein
VRSRSTEARKIRENPQKLRKLAGIGGPRRDNF